MCLKTVDEAGNKALSKKQFDLDTTPPKTLASFSGKPAAAVPRTLFQSEELSPVPQLESLALGPTHYWQTPAITLEVGVSYTELLSFTRTVGYGTGSVAYQLSPNGSDW